MLVSVLMATLALSGSGCGTFLSSALPHDGPTSLPRPYGGVREDALLIQEAVANGPLTAMWVTPLALLDMPFSFIADTVNLPNTFSAPTSPSRPVRHAEPIGTETNTLRGQ